VSPHDGLPMKTKMPVQLKTGQMHRYRMPPRIRPERLV